MFSGHARADQGESDEVFAVLSMGRSADRMEWLKRQAYSSIEAPAPTILASLAICHSQTKASDAATPYRANDLPSLM